MDAKLQKEYEHTLQMAEEARKRCYSPVTGELVPMIKDKNTGKTVSNPYLAEYHKLIEQARKMARDLGITAPKEEMLELEEATDAGDNIKQLETLIRKLAYKIDTCEGRGMAALAREYREAMKDLAEAKKEQPAGDNIDAIIARKADPNKKRFSVVG